MHIFCQLHRLKESARPQVTVFQRSYAKKSPCPPPELCCVPNSCFPALKTFPRADKTTEPVCGLMGNNSYCTGDDLRETTANALEMTSSSRLPQERQKGNKQARSSGYHCPARNTSSVPNGLPCICLRNKTKQHNNNKKGKF